MDSYQIWQTYSGCYGKSSGLVKTSLSILFRSLSLYRDLKKGMTAGYVGCVHATGRNFFPIVFKFLG